MMNMKSYSQHLACGALVSALLATTGCQELPGNRKAQGATIGGLGGAAAGAVIAGEDNRLLGALLGGALGAGGGYIIGANTGSIEKNDRAAAQEAARRAENQPVTAQQARNATTADVNGDGFVTMDEVIALDQAGYTDQEIIDRLEATDQVFELTQEQRDFLTKNGVSQQVVSQMNDLNRDARQQLGRPSNRDIIGRPGTASGGSNATY